jgi:hypothetical protein
MLMTTDAFKKFKCKKDMQNLGMVESSVIDDDSVMSKVQRLWKICDVFLF